MVVNLQLQNQPGFEPSDLESESTSTVWFQLPSSRSPEFRTAFLANRFTMGSGYNVDGLPISAGKGPRVECLVSLPYLDNGGVRNSG